MLPDIADEEYQRWRNEQDTQARQAQIDAMAFDHATSQQIATAFPSSDALTNPVGTRFASAPVAPAPQQPESEPQPAPVEEQPPQPVLPTPSAPPPASFSQPPPTVTAPPSPTPRSGGGGLNEWFGEALGAVEKAGGDVQKFAANMHPGLDFGAALSAAEQAGADIPTFASSLGPPPKPAPAAAPTTPLQGAGATAGSASDKNVMADYIRQAAARRGIDPDVAVTVANNEGLNTYVGDSGSSFGPFQLHYGGIASGGNAVSGLGDAFTKQTGLDARDPRTWQQQVDFALDNVRSNGWGAFHGAAAAGIGNKQGIGGSYEVPVLGGIQRAVDTGVSAVRGAANQISQFGDKQLTNDEAYAACGPAAAVRFASMFGRNPTLREATDMARTVGWTPGSGMAGLSSEKALMDKLGVATKLVSGAQWDVFAREAQSGNPVTISTPGHYFFADGYDPTSGAFHVGRSGTDLQKGSEWMTPAQMTSYMGQVQGGLLADNPSVPAPSQAEAESNPLSFLGKLKDDLGNQIASTANNARQSIAEQLGFAQDTLGNIVNPMVDRQAAQFESDRRRLQELNDQIMATQPGAPLEAAVRGVQGRVGEVLPKTGEDFWSRTTAPSGPVAEGPGLEALGRGFSALGTGTRVAMDVGNEVNPFTALARLHAGEDQLLWSNPEYQDLMHGQGITRDMSPGDRAIALLGTDPTTQQRLADLTREVRARGADVVSQAAWQNPEREDFETRYQTLGGLAAAAVAPQGLASGAGRFAASLALDPGSAPFGVLAEAGRIPELLGGGRRGAELASLLDRTGIGAGGLGTPRYNFPAGGIEEGISNALRDAARSSPDGVARLDSAAMGELPGMPTLREGAPKWQQGLTPHLDDVREAIDNGLPQSHWYSEFAKNVANLVGKDNINEFRTLFGITSQQTAPNDNLNYTLGLMRMAREFQDSGTEFTVKNIYDWMRKNPVTTGTGALGKLEEWDPKLGQMVERRGGWGVGDDQLKKIVDLYTTGRVNVASNAKTPSYSQNILSALGNLFDPNSTMDTWMAQLFNYRNPDKVQMSEQAYQAMRTVVGHLAGELGLNPHQAQAAAWFSIKAIKDFARTAEGGRTGVRAAVKDFEKGGQTTLGDLINLGKQHGVYANPKGTWADTIADRGVASQIAQLQGVLHMPAPEAARGAFMQFPGKTSRSVIVSPTTTAQRLQEAMAGAGSVTAHADDLARLGYNPETQQLEALGNIPHVVEQHGDQVQIRLPGGNVDSLSYAGAIANEATGRAADVHIFDPDAAELAGWKILDDDGTAMSSQKLEQVRAALEDYGIRYAENPDGTITALAQAVQDPEYEDRLADVLGTFGGATTDVTGVIRRVGNDAYSQTIEQLQSRYHPTGRPGLPGRSGDLIGGPGDYGAGRIAAPDLSAGAVPAGDLGGNLASIVSRGAAEGLRSSAARGAIGGGAAAGYQAAQEEGATPESVALAALGGAGLGAAHGAAIRSPGAARALGVIGRDGRELLDQYGRVLGKPTDAEARLELPGQHPDELAGRTLGQLFDPRGELLSTVARGPRLPGQVGPGEVSNITRTELGAEQTADVQEKLGRIMPMLTRMAKDMPDVQASILRSIEENPELFDRYRDGPQSFEQVQDLAARLGMTADDFLKSRVGQAFNAQEQLALHGAIVSKQDELKKLSQGITASRRTAAELSPEEKLDYIRTALDASRLVTVGTGAASTTGRALNILKQDVDRRMAQMLTGSNLAVRAQKAVEAAEERAARLVQLRERTRAIQQEKEEALDKVAEATGLPRTPRTSSSPRKPRASSERPEAPTDQSNILEKINRAYAELDAYQAMSLEEKGEDWAKRNAQRLENAEKRRAALEEDSPERLLKALQDELAGERKLFAGNKKTWEDLAFRREKIEELTPEGSVPGRIGEPARMTEQEAKRARGAEAKGTAAWLDAQRRSIDAELSAANGRAKAAHTAALRDKATQRNMAERILERLGGQKINDSMIDSLVQAMGSENPMYAAKVLKGMQKVNNWNRFNTIRYGGMLASSATHLAQTSANAIGAGMTVALHPLATGFDIGRYGLSKVPVVGRPFEGERTRYMSEMPRRFHGLFAGLDSGKEDALQILRTGINPSAVSRNWEQASRPGFAFEQTRIGQRLPESIRLPNGMTINPNEGINGLAEGSLRLMEAGDALIRGSARGSALEGLAERQAIREGIPRGAARDAYVQEILQNIDEYPHLLDEAEGSAARAVLQEQRQEVQKLTGLIGSNNIFGQVASIAAMPFVRTPANLTAQLLGYSPLGFAGAVPPLVKAAMTDIPKGQGIADAEMRTLALARRQALQGEFADRMARATYGTGGMYLAKGLADGGHLTGPYPEDQAERDTLPPGWKPWALKVGLPGVGDTYIPFSNITGGAGMPLAMGAAWSDAEKHNRDIDRISLGGRMASGFGRYLLDQSMLQGLSNIVDVIKDPAHKFENYIESVGVQNAPGAGFARQLDRALGTSPRDPHGVLEALEAVYPGLSGRVQAKMDALGRPVQQTQTGLAAFLPQFGIEQPDDVLQALREADVGIGTAPESYANYAFTDDERNKIFPQQAGYYIQNMVRDVMQDSDYIYGTTEDKNAMLKVVITQARRQAAMDILDQLSDDELDQRAALQAARKAPNPIER